MMADIPDYPSNAERKVRDSVVVDEPNKKSMVVSAPVKQIHKRPTFWQAMFDMGNKSFTDFFLEDLLYPNLKRTASTILHGMVSRVFGGSFGQTNYNDRYVYSRTWDDERYRDYSGISTATARQRDEPSKRANRDLMRMDSFVFPSREECEKVLSVLDEQIDIYHWAPVSAFYEAIGITAPQTYFNYGWSNIASAKIRPVDAGFVIEMPRPKQN